MLSAPDAQGEKIAQQVQEEPNFQSGLEVQKSVGQYAFKAKPNLPAIDESEEDSFVVLPVAGAFQQNIIGKRSINTLQEWEGYVSSIGTTNFDAVLSDLTDKSRDQEFATIPLSNLNDEEKRFLKLGAAFRFVIGFAVTARGNRINDHVIYFRRYTPSASHSGKVLTDLVRSLR